MMEKLADMGAKNINDKFLKDRGESKNGKGSDKIRYTFTIMKTEEALACYKFFIDRFQRRKQTKSLPKDDDLQITESIMIYL